jgi:hypothetical protein
MLNKSLKIAILALVGITALPANAMVSFAVKGGASLSTAAIKDSGGDSIDGLSYGMGYMGGVGLDVGMGPIGIMADFLYAKRTIKFELDTPIGTIEGSQAITQLFIPVQAKFSIIPMLFVSGGGYYSMGLGEIKTFDKDGDETSSESYKDAGTSSSDYGLVAGLGVALPLMATTLTLEARYNYGLSNMDSDPSGDAGTFGRSIDILAGVTF